MSHRRPLAWVAADHQARILARAAAVDLHVLLVVRALAQASDVARAERVDEPLRRGERSRVRARSRVRPIGRRDPGADGVGSRLRSGGCGSSKEGEHAPSSAVRIRRQG